MEGWHCAGRSGHGYTDRRQPAGRRYRRSYERQGAAGARRYVGGEGGSVDIAALVKEAARFQERTRRVKQGLGNAGFEWYPYDTLSALGHLEKLLTAANRGMLDGRGRVLD